MKLKFKNSFELGAELNEKRVRLIIYRNGDEFVCKKESFNNLEKFLNQNNDHILKGSCNCTKSQPI